MPTLRLIDNDTCLYLHAGSVDDMRRRPVSEKAKGDRHVHLLDRTPQDEDNVPERTSPQDWYGAPSRLAALDRIEKGWPEGVAKVRAALQGIEAGTLAAPRSTRRRKAWGDDGDTCDPDRIARGDYDRAFQRTKRQAATKNGRMIRLFCQSGGHSANKSSELFWSGAASIHLIDLLEEAGYRVEVLYLTKSLNAFASTSRVQLSTFTLKAASDPMNIDQITAALCLSGFLRLYYFYSMMTYGERPNATLGIASLASPKLLTAAGIWIEGDIIVPFLRSQQQAIAFVKQTLREIEVGPEPEGPDPFQPPAEVAAPPVAPNPVSPAKSSSAIADDLLRRAKAQREEGEEAAEAERNEMLERLQRDKDTKDLPLPLSIVAFGNVWPHRKALGQYGFRWTQGSLTWVADDNEQSRRLEELGLDGVTFVHHGQAK